jgi:apolipoprotein D and lipocalin family protein
VLVAFCASCTGIPDGVQAVEDFELQNYLGTWYEIARLDHRFERGLSSVTATYSLRDDGGVKVVNRGYDADAAEWDEVVGKAYFIGDTDVGRLKVSFFGPFYGAYNVVALDRQDYRYSLVVGPNRSYLWILARSPDLDRAIVQRLVDKAEQLGFATDELIFVRHGAATTNGGD